MNHKSLVKALATTLVISSSVASMADESKPGCRTISGHFTVHTFSDMGCASPVGLCGTVEWRGDIKATSNFVATSVIPTEDTTSTGVILTTGDATIALRDGTLVTKDAVVLRTVGNGDFAEIDTIVAGTGAYAGASGAWRASGTIQGNNGEGIYRGEICR